MYNQKIHECNGKIQDIEKKLKSPFSIFSSKSEENHLESTLVNLRLELGRLYLDDGQEGMALAELRIAHAKNQDPVNRVEILMLLVALSPEADRKPYLEALLLELFSSTSRPAKKKLPEYLDLHVKLFPPQRTIKIIDQLTNSLNKTSLDDSAVYVYALELKINLLYDLKEFRSASAAYGNLIAHYEALKKRRPLAWLTTTEIYAYAGAYSLASLHNIPFDRTLKTSLENALKSDNYKRYDIVFTPKMAFDNPELFQKIAFWYSETKLAPPKWFPLCQIQKIGIKPAENIPHARAKAIPSKMIQEESLLIPEHERIQKKITRNWNKSAFAGYPEQTRELLEKLILPRAFPREQLKKTGIKMPRGGLIYGPPGTGKTLLVKTVGIELLGEENVQVVNGPELVSKYVGESAEKLRAILDKAINSSGTRIVLIDEIDALVGSRDQVDGVSNQVKADLTTTLLTYLDGIHENDNLMVIGTTNYLDRMDKALVRAGRLEVHIHIGLPDISDRFSILALYLSELQKNNIADKNLEMELLARESEGLSGAGIKAFIDDTVKHFILPQLVKYEETGLKIADLDTIKPLGDQQFLYCLNAILSAGKPGLSEKEIVFSRPFCLYNPQLEAQLQAVPAFARAFHYSRPLLVHVYGDPGTGATTFGLHLFSEAPEKIVYMKAGELVNLSAEAQKKCLDDNFSMALSKKRGIFIIDDLEDINACHYSPLIYLRNCLKKALPEGETAVIILISKHEKTADNLFNRQLVFDVSIAMPLISQKTEVITLAKSLGLTMEDTFPLPDLEMPIAISKLKSILMCESRTGKGNINIASIILDLNRSCSDNPELLDSLGLFHRKQLSPGSVEQSAILSLSMQNMMSS